MYQRIRDLREDKDLTQKDVAKMLNDTQQHYQLYESGKREPPFFIIILLAKIYGVSIDYIAGLTNSKNGNCKGSKEEIELLGMYNKLSEEEKGNIKGRMELFIEQKEKKAQPRDRISIKQGDNGKATVNIHNK